MSAALVAPVGPLRPASISIRRSTRSTGALLRTCRRAGASPARAVPEHDRRATRRSAEIGRPTGGSRSAQLDDDPADDPLEEEPDFAPEPDFDPESDFDPEDFEADPAPESDELPEDRESVR
ncbi:hypothetical protein [Leucobacter manosquensis]|uniref:hypothetical protein n=1 Tax=Leucobacter manosquensis TaxID=2810611 RepID=UPI003D2A8D39